MIPSLIEIAGAPWPVLPPGIHWATLAEIEDVFAATAYRKRLFDGFVMALQNLTAAGCRRAYLDGSFVTGKPFPGDFDACWDADGVDARRLDPVLLNFKNERTLQKRKYLGELFVLNMSADGEKRFLEFFQIEKHTGEPKGIIGIEI